MYKRLVSTVNMSREKWLEWRKKGIGGSDASINCGINKYKSGVELWMEEVGLSEPKQAGEAAYWGTLIEPLIRDEFSKQTGLSVRIIQMCKCPYTLGLVKFAVNPCHQCKNNNYSIYHRLIKARYILAECKKRNNRKG